MNQAETFAIPRGSQSTLRAVVQCRMKKKALKEEDVGRVEKHLKEMNMLDVIDNSPIVVD